MQLGRVLRRDLPLFSLQEGAEVSEDTVSAANAQHFLVSESGRLSVFCLDADPNVDGRRVAVALAAGGSGQPADMSWCVVSSEALGPSLRLEQTPGNTFDAGVNSQHLDICDISMSGLARLATAFVRQNQVETINMWDVAAALKEAIDSGLLKNERLSEWLKTVEKSKAMKRAIDRRRASA